jgi:DNA-binding SARP family transcriptional activator
MSAVARSREPEATRSLHVRAGDVDSHRHSRYGQRNWPKQGNAAVDNSVTPAGATYSTRSPVAPTTCVEVRLLNSFEVRCDHEPVAFPMSARRLLAFLALHGRALLRVHVAGALWIDVCDERAFANLRSTLWRVNQRGPRLVETNGTSIALADDVSVDVRDAEAQARQLIDGRAREIPRLDDLAFAAELLPDWYDDWVLLERERYRQLALHALEALAERLAEAHRYGEAADAALAAVAAEPLRESAHRLLIRVHLAEGNPTEAIREYRLYSRLLHDQLGLQPSPQIRKLVGSL